MANLHEPLRKRVAIIYLKKSVDTIIGCSRFFV
jgi:hypothetical protein